MHHTMHLRPGVAKQPNLELKTWPKQLLGSLPLVIALHGSPFNVLASALISVKARTQACTLLELEFIEVVFYQRDQSVFIEIAAFL
jgi:hypothetical protein